MPLGGGHKQRILPRLGAPRNVSGKFASRSLVLGSLLSQLRQFTVSFSLLDEDGQERGKPGQVRVKASEKLRGHLEAWLREATSPAVSPSKVIFVFAHGQPTSKVVSAADTPNSLDMASGPHPLTVTASAC